MIVAQWFLEGVAAVVSYRGSQPSIRMGLAMGLARVRRFAARSLCDRMTFQNIVKSQATQDLPS
jgi:hypothetical protein